MGVRVMLLAASAAWLCGCGRSSSSGPAVAGPTIEFTQAGDTWSADPVRDELADVSNNGAGYTGEIDVYKLVIPADGRLQVSLSWEGNADFDLIVAADRLGQVRLVEGLLSGVEPEYVGLDVVAGQEVFLLVAGWEGDPGEYTLEAALVGPDVPVFALVETTDFTSQVPGNLPIRFVFNQDLEPDQPVVNKLAFVTTGFLAEGIWCIDGNELVFYPRLPQTPGDPGGLRPDRDYTLQFAAAAHGVRAASGEYLDQLYSMQVQVIGPADEDAESPPVVLGLDHPQAEAWAGQPVAVLLNGALDPRRLGMELVQMQPDGTELSLPIFFSLEQEYECTGVLSVRLIVEPADPLPPQSIVRLSIPGWVTGISGDPDPSNRIGSGAGWSIDLQTR